MSLCVWCIQVDFTGRIHIISWDPSHIFLRFAIDITPTQSHHWFLGDLQWLWINGRETHQHQWKLVLELLMTLITPLAEKEKVANTLNPLSYWHPLLVHLSPILAEAKVIKWNIVSCANIESIVSFPVLLVLWNIFWVINS